MRLPLASLIIVVGLCVLFIGNALAIDPSRPEDDPDLLAPLPRPELVLPQAYREIQKGEDTEFIWKTVEGAAHYTLLVIRTSHPTNKWTFRNLSWNRKSLNLVPGTYNWKVIAYSSDGSRNRPSKNAKVNIAYNISSEAEEPTGANSPPPPKKDRRLYPPYDDDQEQDALSQRLERGGKPKETKYKTFSPEWLNLSASFDLLLRSFSDSAMGVTYSYTPHLLNRASPVNLVPEGRISYFSTVEGDGFFMLKGGGELQLKIYNKTYIGISSGLGRSYRYTNSQGFHYFGLIAGRRYFLGEGGKFLDRTFVRFEFNSSKPRFRHLALGLGFNF